MNSTGRHRHNNTPKRVPNIIEVDGSSSGGSLENSDPESKK